MIDISLLPQFNDLVGFTEQEIKNNFTDYIARFAQQENKKEEALLSDIQHWYNGYSWDGQHKIYNPFAVVHLFHRMSFDNFWFESGTPNFLIELIKKKYALEQAHQLTIPEFENFVVSKNIYDTYNLKNLNLVSLLLQTGYLTIVERIGRGHEELLKLGFPNQEVRLSFSDYLLEAFTEKDLSWEIANNKFSLKTALKNKDIAQFMSHIKAFFATIPYVLKENADAAYYHTVFYALLSALGFKMYVEKMTDKGRIDGVIALEDTIFVLEFKYSKTGTMAYWLKEGMKQIHELAYYEQFEGQGRKIMLMTVVFLEKLDKNNKKVLRIEHMIEER